ncbi:hypothetical protein FXO37_25447 [Capsicum annuum]|nr:hypothetical protein FXO37_25447 [Capsicum annuum]
MVEVSQDQSRALDMIQNDQELSSLMSGRIGTVPRWHYPGNITEIKEHSLGQERNNSKLTAMVTTRKDRQDRKGSVSGLSGAQMTLGRIASDTILGWANFDARIFGGDPDFLFFVSLVVIPLLQSHFCGIFYFSLRYPFVHSLLLVFFSFLAVTFPPFTYSDGASRFPLISEANAWVDDVYYTPLPIVTIKRVEIEVNDCIRPVKEHPSIVNSGSLPKVHIEPKASKNKTGPSRRMEESPNSGSSVEMDNLLTWDGVAMNAEIVASYDIDFVAIIRYEIHKWAFGEMATLPFLYIEQLLCDEASIPEVPGVGHKVEAIGVAQTDPVSTSSVPPRPSTTTTVIGMVFVSREFLNNLVESKSATTTQLENVEANVASLYGQIQPWVRMILKAVETRLQDSHRDEILEFQDERMRRWSLELEPREEKR